VRLFGLGGGKPDVQVSVDRTDVLPAETVWATVSVRGGKKDVSIREGRLRLVMDEAAASLREGLLTETPLTAPISGRPGFDVAGRVELAEERKVAGEQQFLEGGVVAADTPSEYTVSVEVPPDAPPTYEGATMLVSWQVEAALVREKGAEVVASAPLRVLSRAKAWDEEPDVVWRDACDLSFRLDRLAFGLGETVPTVRTANSRVRWLVKGDCSRGTVTQEVYVHSALG
jgi:hypothetical protein